MMNRIHDAEYLTTNILGVVHNMKSVLMAVDGYVDLLAQNGKAEVYEGAKHATGELESVINNLVFALRACRNNDKAHMHLNRCVESAIELIRSNDDFRGKAKFSFDFAENDEMYVIPSKLFDRLVDFLSREALGILENGEYKISVTTVREADTLLVRVGDNSIRIPNESH